ncbi:MAG: indole-3-glycerol phosphate synthase TrpC [Candidatus Hadarchaeia archaeon]
MKVLEKILESVQKRVEFEKKRCHVSSFDESQAGTRSLKESLLGNPQISVIAELKKASPSEGLIRRDFNPPKLAESFERGGVKGISVLTEPEYFKGNIKHIGKVRKKVDVPVLRKDFILDEYQLYQTAHYGADAVLLITEILGKELKEFIKISKDLGLEPLVEVREKKHAEIAMEYGADLVGINNRNLKTMRISFKRTEKIARYLPDDTVVVSESGVDNSGDILTLREYGVDAVLVGTSIMKSNDVEDKVRELSEVSPIDRN